MPHHEQMMNALNDPVGALRAIWDDTGWRFVILTSGLIFLLETIGDLADVDQQSIWWGAEILTAVVVGRVLTMRPLRSKLSDVENMTVALSVLGLIICEYILSYSTVGGSFAAEPIFWPFSLMLILTVVGARLLAPYATRPLVVWVLVFSFLQFWMNLAFWQADVTMPSPAWTWAGAMAVFAFVARWIAGKGIDGPILSPLNVALVLFVFLDWWLEFGLDESGVGVDWLGEDLYWPWILVNSGLAVTVAYLAPHITSLFAQDSDED